VGALNGTFAVRELWLGRRRGPSVVEIADGLVSLVDADPAGLPTWSVSLMPGVVDRHVHLGLVSPADLDRGPVVEVHDLGSSAHDAAAWRQSPPDGVRVRATGPFHTAPGGYPAGRPWVRDGWVRTVADATEAETAVADALAYEADALKIVLHGGAPTLDDELLGLLIGLAHEAGLRVVAHAEGTGQVARAIDAGVDVLAHAPWSERLPDELLRRATRTTWLSTLAIHDEPQRAVAVDNVERFRAAGGTVVYGTDLGNGSSHAGPSLPELLALERAGIAGDDLIAAVVHPAVSALAAEMMLVGEAPLPATAAELGAWLTASRRLTAASEVPA